MDLVSLDSRHEESLDVCGVCKVTYCVTISNCMSMCDTRVVRLCMYGKSVRSFVV